MHPNYGPPYPAVPPAYGGPVPSAPARGGRGLAITGLVLSALALLGVIVLAVLFFSSGVLDHSGSSGPLTGQLSQAPAGAALSGADLAAAVSGRIQQDGGDVSRMSCPDTAGVAQGVVTVCHGVISGSDYAIVVYFEDKQGRFTLEPL